MKRRRERGEEDIVRDSAVGTVFEFPAARLLSLFSVALVSVCDFGP
jgi:hypothetical protein